jgi:hypothetical protein
MLFLSIAGLRTVHLILPECKCLRHDYPISATSVIPKSLFTFIWFSHCYYLLLLLRFSVVIDNTWLMAQPGTPQPLRRQVNWNFFKLFAMYMSDFWVMTSFCLVGRYESFGGTYCLLLQGACDIGYKTFLCFALSEDDSRANPWNVECIRYISHNGHCWTQYLYWL